MRNCFRKTWNIITFVREILIIFWGVLIWSVKISMNLVFIIEPIPLKIATFVSILVALVASLKIRVNRRKKWNAWKRKHFPRWREDVINCDARIFEHLGHYLHQFFSSWNTRKSLLCKCDIQTGSGPRKPKHLPYWKHWRVGESPSQYTSYALFGSVSVTLGK